MQRLSAQIPTERVEEDRTSTRPVKPSPTSPDAAAWPVAAPATRRWLIAVIVTAGAAAAIWIGAAILTAGHGFDQTDEGFYLLSYRWWRSSHRNFTGAQYLYGPVFQLLGYNVAGLRLFRLTTVVTSATLFGWTVMRWLRPRRPNAPATRLWEVAGTLVIVACGGMLYSWLPQSPGYNDAVVLTSLLAASGIMRMASDVDRGVPTPRWVPALLGPVILAMLLARWSSTVVTLGMIGIVGVIVVAPRGARQLLATAAWILAGALGTALLMHLLVTPLSTAVSQIVATNQLLGASSHSPDTLLRSYYRGTVGILRVVVREHWVLLLASVLAVALRGRVARWVAGPVAVVGLGISAWHVYRRGGFYGGPANLGRFCVSMLLVLLIAAVLGVGAALSRRLTGDAAPALSDRRQGLRGWAILGMLAMLPVAQAFGTSNRLHVMAINAFAAWGAIIVVVLTGLERTQPIARGLAVTATAAAVALSACVPATGLWSYPYRTAARAHTTSVATGVPALASVRLDPSMAAGYSALHRELAPYLDPPGRAIMAFDRMAGVVFALDGRTVGEAWYPAKDRARTAANIRAECHGRRVPGDPRPPILIFSRPVSDFETAALRACGFDFAADYRLLAPKDETMGLEVYVPTRN